MQQLEIGTDHNLGLGMSRMKEIKKIVVILNQIFRVYYLNQFSQNYLLIWKLAFLKTRILEFSQVQYIFSTAKVGTSDF